MNKTQTLSPRPSIDEALVFLGMSDMDKAMGINALLRISKDDDLPLFFDEKLVLVSTSVKYGDQYDENGEFEDCLLIDPVDTQELCTGHILANFQLHISSNNSLDLIVNKIIHDDDSYYIYQDDGTHSEGVSIGYEKFYFDRNELIKYQTEYHSHFNERDKAKTNNSKSKGVLEERITAFKYWLVGHSGKSIHKQKDLQDCYKELKEPTKKEIWRRLNQMDSELFRSGEIDFNRAVSKVIEFTKGTGLSRTTDT
jgi:hypothetical protein